MKPKQKGDLAVAEAIHYYMTNGYEVCLPIGDKRPYDLIAEFEGKMQRVQIKYAGFYNAVGKHKVALRITDGNQSRHTAQIYNDEDFDTLFVYTASGRKFVLPWEEVKVRNELSIEHNKYSAYEIK